MPLSAAGLFLDELPQSSRLLLAVSGGPDSLAMLCWIAAKPAWRGRLVVAHVNHALSRDAADAEKLVRKTALTYAVPCVSDTVAVDAEMARGHKSLEAAARLVRYAALERLRARTDCDWVATAHTQDDNAETVLMKLKLGSAWFELTGIPAHRGRIVRPFLRTTRAELRAGLPVEVAAHEDSMNFNPRFLRVQARMDLACMSHEASPMLAMHGRKVAQFLNLAGRLTNVFVNSNLACSSDPATLLETLPKNLYLEGLDFVLVEKALARRLQRPDFRLPSAVRRQILDFTKGRTPLASLAIGEGLKLHRAGPHHWIAADDLHCHIPPICVNESGLTVSTPTRFAGFESGELCINHAAVRGAITSRTWYSGERFRPLRRKSRKIADWLRDARIQPAVRRQWPVLQDELGIIAIPGLGVCERVAPLPSGNTLHIRWESTTQGAEYIA